MMRRHRPSDPGPRPLRRIAVLALLALLVGPAAHLVVPEGLDHHLDHDASQLVSQVVLGAHHEHDGPHAEAELVAVDPHRHAPCDSCLRALREVASGDLGVPVAQSGGGGAAVAAVATADPDRRLALPSRPRGPPVLV